MKALRIKVFLFLFLFWLFFSIVEYFKYYYLTNFKAEQYYMALHEIKLLQSDSGNNENILRDPWGREYKILYIDNYTNRPIFYSLGINMKDEGGIGDDIVAVYRNDYCSIYGVGCDISKLVRIFFIFLIYSYIFFEFLIFFRSFFSKKN